MGDPSIRPSERQAKHEALVEQRRQHLVRITAQISGVEATAEEVKAKLEAAGGIVGGNYNGNADGGAGALAGGGGEGWASYLDEQSGRHYWFNEHTGEAYYDDSGG